ncbi:MAG TPA: peptidoglycan DD-metalloendopeptidase family protein [Chitinispirillaceae bacterium]|nr:peptidoglycan DD-metalloendopeptidase family protein [Chitinispirillaceae bacterium]
MDRKYECSSKISGLILLFLSVLIGTAQAQESDLLKQYDRDITANAGALDSIKTEIEKGRQVLVSLQKDEGNYLERLEQIEKNISTSRLYLSILQGQIDSVETVIQNLKDSLVIAQGRLQDRKIVMVKRLRIAYKQMAVNPMMILLESKNPVEFITRTRYLQEINRYDKRLMNEITTARQEIDQRSIRLQQQREELSELLASKKSEQKMMLDEEMLRKTMLTDVRSKKQLYTAMISELEEAQKQLNIIITTLQEKRKKAKKQLSSSIIMAFEKRKGKLAWPVEGKVVSPFGKIVHPVYKTVTMNNGIDIGASKGVSVRCVAPGTVIHTGWMRGLGQIVIVDHNGGYITVYAHLQEIAVRMDQTVDFGTRLGDVGDTGSMGDASLHFEIRKSTDAFNPSEWLEK